MRPPFSVRGASPHIAFRGSSASIIVHRDGSYPRLPSRNLDLVVSVLLVDCETVQSETHNTTLSPASRALERGRSVRGYPTHVPDPFPSFAHPV